MVTLSDATLAQACRSGDLSTLSTALQSQPSLLNLRQHSGWTLLARCAACDQRAAVHFLLQQGADPNARNVIGETALHQAVERDGIETVKELLAGGADPNAQNVNGETALHIAARKGYATLARVLIEHEAEPLIRTKAGLSALDVCCKAELRALLSPLETKASQTPVLDTSSEPYDEIPPIPPQSFDRLSLSPQSSRLPSEALPGFFTSPPFTPKETGPGHFSVFEPDAEKADISLQTAVEERHLALVQWLRQLHLEEAVKPLIEAGFDDLDQLIAEMKRAPMSPEQLMKVGIGKKGQAIRLLAALEIEHKQSIVETTPREKGCRRYWGCCTSTDRSTGLSSYPGLQQWLTALDLGSLLPRFLEAGYTELDQVLMVMRTSYAFTDSTLEQDLHISKPGYRHRLLSKLKEDSLFYDPPLHRLTSRVRMERAESPVACELCTFM